MLDLWLTLLLEYGWAAPIDEITWRTAAHDLEPGDIDERVDLDHHIAELRARLEQVDQARSEMDPTRATALAVLTRADITSPSPTVMLRHRYSGSV